MINEKSPIGPSSSSSFGIPIAIVLAGGLIAFAVYMGGKSSPATTPPGSSPFVLIKDANGNPVPGAVQAGIPGQSGAPVQSPTPVVFKPITDQDHIRGANNAKVTILEYSDLECPYCKKFHPVLQQALKEYPDDVRWVYRHYPIKELHSQAPQEAVASECANEQGKFWEFIDKIYETTPGNNGLDLSTLPQIAKEVGVADANKFANCLKSKTYDQFVKDEVADAQQSGANGTPYSILIGPKGQKVPVTGAVSYDQLKGIIDQLLKS